ncbi:MULTISPECIES: DNA-primase RepB domain-containing protein [unclassified Aliiroseovarius]|uniref:DNA-primase RepB domain-containing protein n=1 Tax=unclassified Aliiroseovarius TaxID=2623558 RepID=UPI00156A0DF3|nr:MULTISPECIES: DNA-primase RepB domain-containing protein [unclassified Aliiroseovarius]NRP28796.1 Mobilization protein A [Aliiroseovarius sp. xm-m-314]NRP78438.1 Mobilization protein A [Aliiroseovarius sp. xm-v-209]
MKKETYKEKALKQLKVMQEVGVSHFKTQLVFGATPTDAKREPKSTKTMPPKILGLDEVEKHLGYWWARNMEGFNVFITPAPHKDGNYTPLVFVDDISRQTLQQMTADSCVPAILIESSPNNFQGWVQLNADRLSASDILETQRYLSHKYGLDTGAHGATQNGRLAGYRNVKSSYAHQKIYTKLVHAYDNPVTFNISENLNNQKSTQFENVRVRNLNFEKCSRTSNLDLSSMYSDVQSSGRTSQSEIDWHFCFHAFRHGYDVTQVTQGIMQFSPDISERKGSTERAKEYAFYTAQKAFTEFQKRHKS